MTGVDSVLDFTHPAKTEVQFLFQSDHLDKRKPSAHQRRTTMKEETDVKYSPR